MTFWLIMTAYIAGWFPSAAYMARAFSSMDGKCSVRYPANANYRSTCVRNHGPQCWQPKLCPGADDAAWGSLTALAWPLLIFPASVYYLSQPRKRKIPNHELIARMEKELDIK